MNANLFFSWRTWISAIVLTVLVTGCDQGPKPVEGFVLPQGDIDRGKTVFAETGCRYCHTVTGETFPPFSKTKLMNVELGGKVYKVQDYGALLTSIVNPSHTISPKGKAALRAAEWDSSKTPMPVFNDVLTVTQLIDLAQYLHSRYEEYGPEYRGYYYVP